MNQQQIQLGQEISPLNQQNQFGLRYKITSKANAQNNDCVYFAIENNLGNNQREVALKFKYKQNVSESEKNFLNLIQNYQSQYEQNHPSQIIQILNVFEYQQYFVTVMEKGQIDLFTHLQQKRTNLSQQEKVKICFELVKSTHFLHTNQVMHRNIKPEHYLKVGEQFKLIDFEKIKFLKCDRILTKGIGTLIFQAPEMVEAQQDYSDKIDIWSLACVFYEIFSQNPLFDYNNYQQIQEKILNHKNNQQEINDKINKLFCDQRLKQLMIQMLQPDPNQRLNSKQVKDQLEIIKSNLSQNFGQTNFQGGNFSPNQQFQPQPTKNLGQANNNFPQKQITNPEPQPRNNYFNQNQQQHNQHIHTLVNQNIHQQQQQNLNHNQQNFTAFQSNKNIEELMNQKFNEQLQNFKIEIGQQLKTFLQDHIEKLFKQYFQQLIPLQSFFEKIKENNELMQNHQQQINNIYNKQMNQNNGINQQQMNDIVLLLENQKSELKLLIQNQQQKDQNIRQQQNELQAKIQIDKDNFNLLADQIQEPFQYPQSIDKQQIDFFNQLNVNISIFNFVFEEICIKKNEQIKEKIIGFQKQYQQQGKPDESFSNNIKIIQQKSKYQQSQVDQSQFEKDLRRI